MAESLAGIAGSVGLAGVSVGSLPEPPKPVEKSRAEKLVARIEERSRSGLSGDFESQVLALIGEHAFEIATLKAQVDALKAAVDQGPAAP